MAVKHHTSCRTTDFTGHVIYVRDGGRQVPFGVVTESYERMASNVYHNSFLREALVQIEDRRFYKHRGYDLRAIARATYFNLVSWSIQQGGSTITQQLARSIANDFRRSLYRKVRELALALTIERKQNKEQILDSYFNSVRWGGTILGVRAAALTYFGREVHRLSKSEQLALVTLLRGPNYYLSCTKAFEKRLDFIQRTLVRSKLLQLRQLETPHLVVGRIKPRRLEVFKSSTTQLLRPVLHNGNKRVITSLEKSIQELCSAHVAQSPYPTSVVVLRKGAIVGLQSSFGASHAHEFHFNVGSTLKPFVYSYLRRKGVDAHQVIKAPNHAQKWHVRELSAITPNASLSDALVHSWNTPFVSCSYEVGMQGVLAFLAKVLHKPLDDLYPSSILGATKHGMTLLELAQAYGRFFEPGRMGDPFVRECHKLLQDVALDKLQLTIRGAFLKTGTSNGNRERLVVGGYADLTFAILREGNPKMDPTKSGGFMHSVRRFTEDLLGLTPKEQYKWIN